MSPTARETALKALLTFSKTMRWPEDQFDRLVFRIDDPRERALAFIICSGVLQNRAYCDFWIGQFASQPIEKMQPAVREILRLSTYQILFLSRVPNHAAVAEGVDLTKRYAGRAASFVNAVLRRIAEHAGEEPVIPGDPVQKLSIRYSHPEWLVRRTMDQLGYDGCAAFLKANNEVPPVSIQVNTLKCGIEVAEETLRGDGADVRPSADIPGAFEILSGAGGMENWKSFQDGLFYVQDISARLAVIAAGPMPGDFVVDGCAAPGGKSFAAGIMMKNRGRILSCDVQDKKLERLAHGARRLGISIMETKKQDGRIFLPELEGKADVVMADVPCSGLGVIRKKPDIRYKTPEEIQGLQDIQMDILRNLSRYVRRGGTLVYSTCTVLKEENEDVVRQFLEEAPDFRLCPFTLPGRFGEVPGGMRTLWPHVDGTDGFFICKMRRE